MALVNCTECQFPISSKAKVCPNCSAPRQVMKTNEFLNEKSKTTRKMATQKGRNISQSILLILIGALVMYMLTPYVNKKEENPEQKYYARVEKMNGLLVYVNSFPVDQRSYSTIETMPVNDIQKIWNSLGIGKDKFGQVLLNIVNTGNENLVFSNLLNKITNEVHSKYSDASGIIINDKLSRCEVIKFN